MSESTTLSGPSSVAKYLTAEDLVSLRKPTDIKSVPAIGEKFYVADKANWMNEKAVECTMADRQQMLQQKRAARICDLMQAEWNEEVCIAITRKLKGKFVQHMGRPVQGKTETALSAEEAVFLLENGHLEILHGGVPMSTEDAYSVMLKEKLAIEKYQVYSHLSRLGYIVVNHQLQLGVTRYEQLMNLDKRKIKKKRKSDITNKDEASKRKCLDFSGCISNNPISSTTSSDCTELIKSTSTEKNPAACSVELIEKDKEAVISNENNNKLVESELDMDVVSYDLESSVHSKSSNVLADEQNPKMAVKEGYKDVVDMQSSNDTDSVKNISEASLSNVENNSCDAVSKCSNMEEISAVPGISGDEANQAKSYLDDSAVVPDDNTVDSEDDETENESTSDNETEVETDLETDKDNSCDVVSVNTRSLESDSVSSLNIVAPEKEVQLAEDIVFVEVKKKESKPMAVIDLLSDDDGMGSSKSTDAGSDDDIQVIKVCKKASKRQKRPTRKAFTKYLHLKTENIKPRVKVTSSMWPFPHLSGKDFICLSRPPTHLLPPNVRPAKEAYPLDLKIYFNRQPRQHPPNRLWNSYKDLQDRSRQRLQNSSSQGPGYQQYGSYHDYNSSESYSRERNVPSYSTRDSNSILPFPSMVSQTNSLLNQRISSPMPPINSFNNFQSLGLMSQDSLNQIVMKNSIMQASTNPNMFNLPSDRLAECMAEVQKTAFRVATSVLSTMFGDAANSNFSETFPSLNSYDQQRSMFRTMDNTRFNSPVGSFHQNRHFQREDLAHNNTANGSFRQHSQWVTESQSRHFADSPAYASQGGLNDVPPTHMQSNYNPNVWNNSRSMLSYDRGGYQRREYRHRFKSHDEFKRNVYPCAVPRNRNSQSWRDLKSAISTRPQSNRITTLSDDDGNDKNNNDEDDDDDIEEVPININEVLWSKDINPLVKPGTRLPVADVFTCLNITKPAKLSQKLNVFEKYLPACCSLEISFDVYLPGSNYRKSCPGIPNHRIVVVRSSDPFPKLSEIVFLQRKFIDGAFLQFAVVDNGDISFYSFNNVELPSLVPHEDVNMSAK